MFRLHNLHSGTFIFNSANDRFGNENSLKILDAILADNAEDLSAIVDEVNVNHIFSIKQYRLPKILIGNPPIISVAAFFGASECTSYLLGIEAGLKQKDHYRRLPSHFAAAGGNLNIFRSLIEMDEDLDQPDSDGNFAVHYAAKMGRTDILKYIWSRSQDKSAITLRGHHQKQPIHYACENGHNDVINFLFELDANCISAGDINNFTPLMYASLGGHLDTVKLILSKNADPDIIASNGSTAITIAAQNGNLSIVKELVKISTQYKKSKRKFNPLVEASAGGHVDIVKFLIENGMNPNIKTSDNMTPFWAALHKNRLLVLKYLLHHGANYELISTKETEKKINPILFACTNSYFDIVRFFLEEKYATLNDMSTRKILHIIQNSTQDPINLFTDYGFNLFDVDYSIIGRADVWEFIKSVNRPEKMYSMLKIAEKHGKVNYGPILEYARFLNDKDVFHFLVDEREYDFSSIHQPIEKDFKDITSKSTQVLENIYPLLLENRLGRKIGISVPQWHIFNYFMNNGGKEPPNTSEASICARFLARLHDAKMLSYGLDNDVKFTRKLIEDYDLLLTAFLSGDKKLFDAFIELNPDVNKCIINEYSYKKYPLGSCLQFIKDFHLYDKDVTTDTETNKAKDFSLYCINKLLEHGAEFITDSFDNIQYAIAIDSDEIFELVKSYSHITKELIDEYQLLSYSIISQSKRYLDWFLSFHPSLEYRKKLFTRSFCMLPFKDYQSNSIFSVIDSFKTPIDFAHYAISKIFLSTTTLQPDPYLYHSLFYVNDVKLLDEAQKLGITFDDDKYFNDILEGVFKWNSSPNCDMLQYLDSHGFQFSKNAKDIFIKIVSYMKCPSRERIKFLMDKGININYIGNDNYTALQEAIYHKQTVYAIYLLDCGADPNIGNQDNTCLMIAATQRHSIYLIYKLLENGAKLGRVRTKAAINQSISYNHYLASLFDQYNVFNKK